jgi:hypothetical protein
LEYLRARAAADACALIDAAAPAVRAERQDLQQEIAARLGPSNAP